MSNTGITRSRPPDCCVPSSSCTITIRPWITLTPLYGHIGSPRRIEHAANYAICRKIVRDRARADKGFPYLHCGSGSTPRCKETPDHD